MSAVLADFVSGRLTSDAGGDAQRGRQKPGLLEAINDGVAGPLSTRLTTNQRSLLSKSSRSLLATKI